MDQLRSWAGLGAFGWAEQGEDQAGWIRACGAARDCGAWRKRCLRVKQRQGLRRKEFPYMEEREKTARKDRVALKRRYNKDIRLSLLYR